MSDVFDLLQRPDWMAQAACRGIDPNLFFPTRPQGEGTGGEMAAAKDVCQGCPVREVCLDYGMDERFGVFGGKSERERRRLRRGRGGRRVAS